MYYILEGRGFDSRWCHWNFSLTKSFRPQYGARVDSTSKRNEYLEYFLGGKGGWCVRLTLPPSCADCVDISDPQPLGTLWACPGLLWDCFTFTFTVTFYSTTLTWPCRRILQQRKKRKKLPRQTCLEELEYVVHEQLVRMVAVANKDASQNKCRPFGCTLDDRARLFGSSRRSCRQCGYALTVSRTQPVLVLTRRTQTGRARLGQQLRDTPSSLALILIPMNKN